MSDNETANDPLPTGGGSPPEQLTDDDERRADIYHKLAERARNRYESFRAIESRLSLGLWTVLVAGAAFVLTADGWTVELWHVVGGTAFVAILILLYATLWLPYVQDVLQTDNRVSFWWETHLHAILGQDVPDQLKPGWKLRKPLESQDARTWHSALDVEYEENPDGYIHGKEVPVVYLHKAQLRFVAFSVALATPLVGALVIKHCQLRVPQSAPFRIEAPGRAQTIERPATPRLGVEAVREQLPAGPEEE